MGPEKVLAYESRPPLRKLLPGFRMERMANPVEGADAMRAVHLRLIVRICSALLVAFLAAALALAISSCAVPFVERPHVERPSVEAALVPRRAHSRVYRHLVGAVFFYVGFDSKRTPFFRP